MSSWWNTVQPPDGMSWYDAADWYDDLKARADAGDQDAESVIASVPVLLAMHEGMPVSRRPEPFVFPSEVIADPALTDLERETLERSLGS